MTAEVLSLPPRLPLEKLGNLPLTYRVDGALDLLRRAQETLARASDLDKRRAATKQLGVLLWAVIDALEKGMAAHAATAQRELGDIILDALRPRTTIGNIKAPETCWL